MTRRSRKVERRANAGGGARRLRRSEAILLTLLGALFLAVRIPGFTSFELWIDEANSVLIALNSPSDIIESLRHDGNPPFYYLCLHLWIALLGHAQGAVRGLSLLFGLGLVGLVYGLGRSWGGRRVAMSAALFVVLSPLHVVYSGEARMYTLLPLLSLLSVFALDRALRGRSPSWAAAYAFTLALCIYTHNYGLFLLPIGVLHALLRRDRSLQCVQLVGIATLSAIILAGPWLPVVAQQAESGVGNWIAPQFEQEIARAGPGPSAPGALRLIAGVARSLEVMAPGARYPSYIDLPNDGQPGILVLLVLLLLVGSAMRPGGDSRAMSASTRERVQLCLLYLLLPMGIPLLYSVTVQPIYVIGRYEMVAFPACALLVGFGVDQVVGRISRIQLRRLAMCGLGLGLIILSSLSLAPRILGQLEADCYGRHVTRHLQGKLRPGDAILFLGFSRPVCEYQMRNTFDIRDYRLISFPRDAGTHLGWYDAEAYGADLAGLEAEAVVLAAQLQRELAAGARLWIIDPGWYAILHERLHQEIGRRFGEFDPVLSDDESGIFCHHRD